MSNDFPKNEFLPRPCFPFPKNPTLLPPGVTREDILNHRYPPILPPTPRDVPGDGIDLMGEDQQKHDA